MKRKLAVLLAVAAIGLATDAFAACSGCGCRGGPGYRGQNGKCVGWDQLARICGKPPTTRCKPEQVNAPAGSKQATTELDSMAAPLVAPE